MMLWKRRPIAYYMEGTRSLEWPMSVGLSTLAIMLFIWPQITANPAFRYFAYALPASLVGITFLACAGASVGALLVNGASKKIGPRVRSWAALMRALLMTQFGVSTVQSGIDQGFPYTVTPFWFTLAAAEVWVAYRAVLDVRNPD